GPARRLHPAPHRLAAGAGPAGAGAAAPGPPRAARAGGRLAGLGRVCQRLRRGAVSVGGMVRDGVISDELWDVLEPVLPTNVGRRGRPWNDHRRTLEGIVWRFRTGSPWRDLPAEFGPYQSVWQRHRLW